MPYLNLDLDYFTHPKTMRFVGLLGKDSAILPIRLWCYVGKYHSTNGSLAGYSPQEVESIIGWWGQPGKMVEAMVKVGFLVESETGYEVMDWLEHQGHLKMFKERAQKAAAERWGISNATSIIQASVKQCPIPYRTKHNQTKDKCVSRAPAQEAVSPPKARLSFQKPTPQEVCEYAASIGFALDGSDFCDYYEARGWRYKGGVAMKDWWAAVRTWKSKRGEFDVGKSKPSGGFRKGDNTAGTVDSQKFRDAGIPE